MNQHNEAVRRALQALAAIAGPTQAKVVEPTRATVAVTSKVDVLANPTGMAVEDPSYWKEEVDTWRNEQCIGRDGFQDRGGVGALHVNFCEWTVAHKSVPCRRETFEHLLRDAGYIIQDGLVFHLVLRADLWATRPFHSSNCNLQVKRTQETGHDRDNR